MARVKKPVYKRSMGESSSSMESPPEGHPMAHWFQSKKDFDHYSKDLAPRKIISPSYFEPNFFEKHHFPNLQACLEAQNLLNHVKIEELIYPELVAVAYTTLKVAFSDDDMNMTFKLGNDTYSLDSTELIGLWHLDYSGDKIELGGSNEEYNRNYSRVDACNLFHIPLDIPKPIVGCLSIEHRLLHYIIVYILVPRANNHRLIYEGDIEMMWRLQSHYKSLNHMRREENQPQMEEEQGGEEEGNQAMEDVQVEPPQEQPLMLDLMRELQMINQNIGSFREETRKELGILGRRMQRMETKMGIQDEEDQD
ncbi:hypothetical protein PIB30_029397 [Stylosanthes scabra]|uniref:Uncharacterized protein n=1 Tax=Stylosanthes scabra TaxID=79078 RepID=A0ABU6VCL4_9FABA|nr:hypothetical protein [Stylosanthes scabra]